MKLYPPQIESKIPAFVYDPNDLGRSTLKVPFQLNKSVSRNQIGGMSLIIKSVQNNKIQSKSEYLISSNILYDEKTKSYYSNFVLDFIPKIGQYYKVQIAFVEYKGRSENGNENLLGEIGYYSSIGITKCTTRPEVIIEGLDAGVSNISKYIYTGSYSQSMKDVTEKVYQYRFDITEIDSGIIFDSSGIQLHDSGTDTEVGKSIDVWTTTKTLDVNKNYAITYTVYTLNNLIVSSASYRIITIDTIDLSINANLISTLYSDDAYVDIHLTPKKHPSGKELLSGNFVLMRSSSKNNFEDWQEIHKFYLKDAYPKIHLWDDFTIQQGYQYRYALQAYNENGIYSNRLESIYYLCEEDEVYGKSTTQFIAEFEDAFLYDGERQLRIRYNPKIASFKSTVLESKVDTLGGKYPFVFRNGNVEYKEFTISGLISYLTDPSGKFLEAFTITHAERESTPSKEKYEEELTTALTRDNFKRERDFKLEVLDWLNNGKPKLFKSPAEGNYIIRTINATLTPNDTVSRMLHTFNCQAYEIADFTLENLIKYEIINIEEKVYKEMKIGMQYLSQILNSKNNYEYSFNTTGGAFYLSFDNQWSKLILQLSFLDNTVPSVFFNISNQTGHYEIPKDILKDNPVVGIKLIDGVAEDNATMTFGYFGMTSDNVFSYISDIVVEDVIEQYRGFDKSLSVNILENIEDFRQSIEDFYSIKVYPRKTISIYYDRFDNKYYYSKEDKVEVQGWDNTAIYKVTKEKIFGSGYYDEYYDGDPTIEDCKINEEINYKFILNRPDFADGLYSSDLSREEQSPLEEGEDSSLREKIDPCTSGRFEYIKNLKGIKDLRIGSGLICDIVYHLKTYKYTIEEEPHLSYYPVLSQFLKNYKVEKERYKELLYQGDSIMIRAQRMKMETAYSNYIKELEKIVKAGTGGNTIDAL